jgi:hypothetical protein
LSIKPNDYRALYNWGLTLMKQAAIKVDQKDTDTADKLFDQSGEKYQR